MLDETKKEVCIVANCSKENDCTPLSCLVNEQAVSLYGTGFEVDFGLVNWPMSMKSILQDTLRLRAKITRLRPSVVHAQYGSIIAFVALLATRDIPLIVSFAGSDLLGVPVSGLRRRIRDLLARLIGLCAAYMADTIIVKSQNLLDKLPAKLQNEAIILPNGVDTELFTPFPKDECRARLGWLKDAKIVLFFTSTGHSHNQVIKNQKLARDAVNILGKRDSNVKLFVISQAAREVVPIMMNAADCLLVTSLHEGSPNVVKEAMACNLPIVSVPCGDVEARLQYVSPGGIYPYDAKALAEGVKRVFSLEMHSNGREEIFRQGLTASQVAKSLIEIYQNVLKFE